MRKEISLSVTVRVTLGSVELMRVMGPWKPPVLSGESKEDEQSWVRGLLFRTRGGYLDPWRWIWAVTFQCPFIP